MYKVMFINVSGRKELRTFNNEENFKTLCQVVWDERINGKIPEDLTPDPVPTLKLLKK